MPTENAINTDGHGKHQRRSTMIPVPRVVAFLLEEPRSGWDIASRGRTASG